jgi:opacity protein-like surface antigen
VKGRVILAIAVVLGIGTATAWGDELPGIAPDSESLPTALTLAESAPEASLRTDEDEAFLGFILPADLSVGLQEERRHGPGVGFTLGPMGGYLNARGADRGTWFGGIQARLHLLRFLAAEASISVHQDRFADGDITVTQWPVQVTGLLFPFPGWGLQPYALAGVGWYYTTVHTRGSKASLNDETDRNFGAHVGAGAEIAASSSLILFGDFRWIFLETDTDAIKRGDFNFWQITFGIGFGF